ncbi:uncharacterized protein LOC107048021 [Diachasma alloeum]|uniref:uncharacterized protein LOC107048021 n=1 Tax=Diachasma alloeum TaxID=454923 RepID=UPI0007383FC0|nr:uncharacterized protein LOC107048021 [Diachasma alloeum]
MASTRLIIISLVIFTSVVISTCLQGESTPHEVERRPLLRNGCVCIKNDCGCCETITWKTFGIDGTVCSNITYLPDDYGISLTLTYNDYVLYNETVSARNPPPICIGIPELEKLSAEICLKLYDLSFGKQHYHGCVAIKVSVYHVIHRIVNVGCFNIPLDYSMSIYSAKMGNVSGALNQIIDREGVRKEVLPSVQMI